MAGTVPPIVAVVGATASGKTGLSLDLAARLGGEVVNTDSMQLYRGMDIGTAKLAVAERRGITHHQLDVLDVADDASVARYQHAARADLASIAARGGRGVVVGGSGLYVRALLDTMTFPGVDPAVRARLEERAERHGTRHLHDELARLDPAAAIAIGPANTRRIVRALEVIEITGLPYTANLPVQEYVVPAVQIGLDCDRAVLDARVDRRVERMWEQGLVAEVLSDASGAIHLANEAGKVSADELHRTLLVLLHSNFAAVATTDAWAAAVRAGEALPKSDLGTSATQGRNAFAG